ncbi:hypothetical protein [Pseudodesulfovibrio sediminis]|uniref:Uncharacterized protein n=1 Tax=Pseudodesulfovibrio sediminis TaxID=2810563 RepID=A0ABM8I352_9BACT|nr:hypothetical protein [Pseudodesulfovibrio sediminis]BCS88890.1 hypothetical protein PSDVSF_21320 [Pseudodesulfovibrio sediminis]
MLTLDVPFLPDGEYPDFLSRHADRIHSVHFPLFNPNLADSRHRTTSHSINEVINGLNTLDGVDKYVLMNARFHTPTKYFDSDSLSKTATILEHLLNKTDLSGLIFADPYFLQSLSDNHPQTTKKLEAIPSINAALGSTEAVYAMLSMIEKTTFKPPSKLVLDRTLNRNLARLESVSKALRKTHPEIHLNLIANEGCLLCCPYKPAHDAHISLGVEGLCRERTFAMNRDLGCVRRMFDEPGAILSSPFIRPEDMSRYEGLVDGIKICGRTKGTTFLSQTITAYFNGSYTGNLLDLMDAMGDLGDRIHIPNQALPDTFFDQVAHCDKLCAACGLCASIMDVAATRIAPGLPRL